QKKFLQVFVSNLQYRILGRRNTLFPIVVETFLLYAGELSRAEIRMWRRVIHIQTMRLFDAATVGLSLNDGEKIHLFHCVDCKDAFTMFTRLFASVSVGLKAFTNISRGKALLALHALTEDTSPLRVSDRVYLIEPTFDDSPVRHGVITSIERHEEGRRCMVAFDDNTDGMF